jgi:hypothetical protein
VNDGHRPPLQKMSILGAVVANCFDRTTFHCFLAKRFFFRRFGLLVNVGMAAVIVALEIGRGGFTTQIAVDALLVDVVLPGTFSGYLFAASAIILPLREEEC